jgi:hypothetical protein
MTLCRRHLRGGWFDSPWRSMGGGLGLRSDRAVGDPSGRGLCDLPPSITPPHVTRENIHLLPLLRHGAAGDLDAAFNAGQKHHECHGIKATHRRLKWIAVVFRPGQGGPCPSIFPGKEEVHSCPSRFIVRETTHTNSDRNAAPPWMHEEEIRRARSPVSVSVCRAKQSLMPCHSTLNLLS